MNLMAQAVEKVILKRIDFDRLLRNKTDIFGFRRDLSTHHAFAELAQEMESYDESILFLDFKKAYNAVNLDKLTNYLKERITETDGIDTSKEMIELITQLINKRGTKIGDRFYSSEVGLRQGSSLSPVLFNLYMDQVISELKKIRGVRRVIAYADDLVLIGPFKFQETLEIFNAHNLSVNMEKTFSMRGKYCENIAPTKEFKYLGISTSDEGILKGYRNMKYICLKKSKQIGGRYKENSIVAMRATEALCGSLFRFHSDREPERKEEAKKDILKCMKHALRIPQNIPPEVLENVLRGRSQSKALRTDSGLRRVIRALHRWNYLDEEGNELRANTEDCLDPRKLEAFVERAEKEKLSNQKLRYVPNIPRELKMLPVETLEMIAPFGFTKNGRARVKKKTDPETKKRAEEEMDQLRKEVTEHLKRATNERPAIPKPDTSSEERDEDLDLVKERGRKGRIKGGKAKTEKSRADRRNTAMRLEEEFDLLCNSDNF